MSRKKVIPLFLLALIWGCYYVASQKAVGNMSVFTVGIVIRFITFLLLSVLMIKRKEMKALLHVDGVLPRLLLIGVLGFLLDLTAFIGLTLSPAGSGTALLKCDILFVNLISVIIYKQKFSSRDWLYTLVMLFGVLLVMGIDLTTFRLDDAGNIFFILSALFVSINAFVIKSVQLDKRNPVRDDVVAFYNNFVTMLLFTATSLIMGTMGQLKLLFTDGFLLKALICAGVGQTLIYVVYYYDLRRFPVWLVKVFLLLMPVVATAISFLLFDETMGGKQYGGMAVVLMGALGILMEQKKKDAGELEHAM